MSKLQPTMPGWTAAALALLWLAAQLPAAAQEVVRVQDYPGLGNLMLRVAIAHQLCDKQDIKCEARTIPAAPLGLQTLLAGDLEVAFGLPELLAVANAGSVLTVRNDYLLKKPQAVAGFVAAMKETEAFMQNPANYEAVLKVSLDTFKIEIPKGPEVVAAVLKTSLPAYRFAMDAKSVQAAADYMLASKQLEKAFDTNRLVFGK